MEFTERLGWMLLGILIGLVLGHIVHLLNDGVDRLNRIEEEVDEIDYIVKHPRKEQGGVTHSVVMNVILGLVVLMVAWSAFASQQASNQVENSQQDTLKSFCQAGQDSRLVQRQTVEAIYNLAVGSIQRDTNAPPLSQQRLQLYNAYIDRVNHFRSSMYNKIKPPSKCAPYVNDFNVKPPTPPVQHITQ